MFLTKGEIVKVIHKYIIFADEKTVGYFIAQLGHLPKM